MAGLYEFSKIDSIHSSSPNAVDHEFMMRSQFNTMVQTLSTWDGNAHSLDNYRMAMLYGMNNPGGAGSLQIMAVNNFYGKLLTEFGFTNSALDSFYNLQINANLSERLPQTGCN